jgi:hypothetical protein
VTYGFCPFFNLEFHYSIFPSFRFSGMSTYSIPLFRGVIEEQLERMSRPEAV